eukprot:EG_transcript_44595
MTAGGEWIVFGLIAQQERSTDHPKGRQVIDRGLCGAMGKMCVEMVKRSVREKNCLAGGGQVLRHGSWLQPSLASAEKEVNSHSAQVGKYRPELGGMEPSPG